MRQQQILNLLTDNEGGASYVSRSLDIPYVTCRRLLTELEKQSKLEVVDYQHGNGGYVYRTTTSDPMPYLESFGKNFPAIAYLHDMAERAKINGGRFTSDGISDATHYMAHALANIFYQAQAVSSTGKVDDSKLNEAREALNRAEKVFAEMAKLSRQILDNRMFWDEELMLRMTKSEMWATRQVINDYETLTTKQE
jgi:predicted ArsR family transcriptional regulator